MVRNGSQLFIALPILQNGFETTFVQCQSLSHAFLDAVVGKQEKDSSAL